MSPERAPLEDGKSARVYFVRCAAVQMVKIGFTRNPIAVRFHTLNTASPLELDIMGWCWAGEDFEEHLQVKYRRDHVRGEWFRLTSALREEIAALDRKRVLGTRIRLPRLKVRAPRANPEARP